MSLALDNKKLVCDLLVNKLRSEYNFRDCIHVEGDWTYGHSPWDIAVMDPMLIRITNSSATATSFSLDIYYKERHTISLYFQLSDPNLNQFLDNLVRTILDQYHENIIEEHKANRDCSG